MIGWFALGFGFALLASTQTDHAQTKPGVSMLVLPVPGAPISFEQIEVRSSFARKLANGTPVVETDRTHVYRNSAGKVLIQETLREGSSNRAPTPSNAVITIIDPVNSRMVVLKTGEKTGCSMPLPTSGSFMFSSSSLAETEDQGVAPSRFRTENLGKRTFEGIEFEGTRIVATREGESGRTRSVEQWHSADLSLIGLVVVSKPDGSYTARIQNLHREEPTPTLFEIPAGYRIIEMSDLE
jgi:hypothetical protein